jgi:ATP-dependent helicase/nuclease subunit B
VLSPELAAALWPPPHLTSITRLESFASCAYRHFAGHGLRLRERDRHEISALHLGNLYHSMLEEFVHELQDTQSTLADLPLDDIRRRLDHIVDKVLPRYVKRLNLDDAEQKLVRWRSRNEVFAAIRAQKATIGRTKLQPHMVERRFGYDGADDLPALLLETPSGRQVSLRGKIDRVDLLDTERGPLALVYDYKRTPNKRLTLARVFYGLEQQLLAYLFVLRDCTDAQGATLIPGGAFYLPLLGPFASVDHPSEVGRNEPAAFDQFRPHGVLDFDWIDAMRADGDGDKPVFRAKRKKSGGGISGFSNSTAVEHDDFFNLLDHVRTQMSELADQWLDGRIEVRPARFRDSLPCNRCPFRGVCRFEYALNDVRELPVLTRSEVVAELRIQRGPRP